MDQNLEYLPLILEEKAPKVPPWSSYSSSSIPVLESQLDEVIEGIGQLGINGSEAPPQPSDQLKLS